MDFQAKLELNSINTMIKDLNLEEGGSVQRFFTNEVWRLSDDYVPFDSGMLKNNTSMNLDGTQIIYNSPYARYQWYGMLMVDPDYLVGGFPLTKNGIQVGFFSRPGVPKILDPSGRAINNFNGIRGPYWTSRMWADRQKEIEMAVQNFIERGGK